jgi:hypothetical protein
LRELTLPTHSSSAGSTRELLMELGQQSVHFIGLPEKSASIVARVVLDSWIIGALSVAPVLTISGPDVSRGNRLIQWFHCVGRHPLRMTGVTPARLCSLPAGLEFTLLISQPVISGKLETLLHEAGRRGQGIPSRGGLLDLFGVQVIHSQSGLGAASWPYRSVQIPMIPTNQPLPIFDEATQHRVSAELQTKLLGYRFANYGRASTPRFDVSRLTHSLQELALSLAATTPDDASLQEQIFALLDAEDREIRSSAWVDFSTVVVESLLFAGREWKGEAKYIGDLAEVAEEIWKGRGVSEQVDPGAYSRRLRLLGFEPEPRDARGVKLRLTDAVCNFAQKLARDFNVPELENREGQEEEMQETKK